MTNTRETIAWIDGYLKGLAAHQKRVDCVRLNALQFTTKKDVIKSYLDFINNNEDFEELEIEKKILILEEPLLVTDWSKVVTDYIYKIFPRLNEDYYFQILYELLDVIGLMIPIESNKSHFKCTAQIGDNRGEYLFLKLEENDYLILSYIHYKNID